VDPRFLLPTLNAALNLTATGLLVCGYVLVKRRRVAAHKRCMLGALLVSALFLASYVAYHALYPPRTFGGEGAAKTVYLFVLGTHVVLAALVPFLALRTAWLGLKDRVERHRRWARWTFPIWLYVSVTGVAVYVMLYLLWPGPVRVA
jgi:uncharacterized membrane protein YozB (DUF420 family)